MLKPDPRLAQLVTLRRQQAATAQRKFQCARRLAAGAADALEQARSNTLLHEQCMRDTYADIDRNLMGKTVGQAQIEAGLSQSAQLKDSLVALQQQEKAAEEALAARQREAQTQRDNLSRCRRQQQKMNHVETALWES